jgi:hypothetical protein
MDQRLVSFEPHQFDTMLSVKRIEGKPLLYYVGDLAGDCATIHNPDTFTRARAFRKVAYAAYEELKCHLVQRQITCGCYEYWAYPGKNVTAPWSNDDIRVRHAARMARGGKLTAAVLGLVLPARRGA